MVSKLIISALQNSCFVISQSFNELKTFVQDQRSLQENTDLVTLKKLCEQSEILLPFKVRELADFLIYDDNLKKNE